MIDTSMMIFTNPTNICIFCIMGPIAKKQSKQHQIFEDQTYHCKHLKSIWATTSSFHIKPNTWYIHRLISQTFMCFVLWKNIIMWHKYNKIIMVPKNGPRSVLKVKDEHDFTFFLEYFQYVHFESRNSISNHYQSKRYSQHFEIIYWIIQIWFYSHYGLNLDAFQMDSNDTAKFWNFYIWWWIT